MKAGFWREIQGWSWLKGRSRVMEVQGKELEFGLLWGPGGQEGWGGGQDLVGEKGEKHRQSCPYRWLKVQKDLLKVLRLSKGTACTGLGSLGLL